MSIEKAIEKAVSQHSLIRRCDLIDMGMSESMIYRILSKKIFWKLSKGVYALRGAPQTWHFRALSKVFSSEPNALLSHCSALQNLGILQLRLEVNQNSNCLIHVTKIRTSRSRFEESIHRSIYPHTSYEGVLVNSIPQVPTEIAIIESASMLSKKQFSFVVDESIRNKMITVQSLKKACDLMKPAPGRRKKYVRELIESYRCESSTSYIESVLEKKVLRIVKSAIDTEIITQHTVFVNNRCYRIDIALPKYKVAIEVDGFAFHRDRFQFDNDRNRQNDLILAGWKILRITDAMNSEEIESQVYRATRVGDASIRFSNV